MNRSLAFTALTVVTILALFAPAAAADKGHGKFELPMTCMLEDVQLESGKYKIEWQGEGAELQVNISKRGKVLVTTSATKKQLSGAKGPSYIGKYDMPNGDCALTEVHVKKLDYSLRFTEWVAQVKQDSATELAQR